MDRRNLLKTLALSALSLPLFGANKKTQNPTDVYTTPLHFKFGNLDLYILSDGVNTLTELHPTIGPKHTKKKSILPEKNYF